MGPKNLLIWVKVYHHLWRYTLNILTKRTKRVYGVLYVRVPF